MVKNNSMKYFKWLFLMIMIIMSLSLFFYLRYRSESSQVIDTKDLSISKAIYYNEYPNEYQNIKNSFNLLFLRGALPITNLKTLVAENTASGDEILSESLGLMMLIALKDQDLNQFNNLVIEMDHLFTKDNGLLKWRIHESLLGEDTVNASIDDLRVVKALYEASELWGKSEFRDRANAIGEALYVNCVKEDHLTSFDRADAPKAILTYYDFKAILYLSKDEKKWERVLKTGLYQVYHERVKSKPFYELDQSTSHYKSIENLLILQHLYEIGLKDEKSIEFIREQMKLGGYYAAYSANGKAENSIESPSVYGIIAQIAQLSYDEDLYEAACKKMINLTNKIDDQYAWAYVDSNTHVGYSFDHLMVLLGL